MNTILVWLNPTRRKAIYSLVAAVGAVAVVVGVVSPEQAASYGGTVVAGIEVLAVILASVAAKRLDVTLIYAAAAAFITALRVAGILDDGTESHLIDLVAHVLALFPLVLAVLRTDTTTPTGEPTPEYQAEHAAVRAA